MGYCRLLVSVDLGPAASDRVRLASALADDLGAALTGVAAHPEPLLIYGPRHRLDPARIREQREFVRAELEDARALFEREGTAGKGKTWRSALTSPLSFICLQARRADLVVVSRHGPNDGDPGELGCSTGDLVMSLGRPLLVVPPNLDRMALDRAVVAWRDTREARRALMDALPLIGAMAQIDVVGVSPETNSTDLDEVAEFLSEHGTSATTHLLDSAQDTVADTLLGFVRERQADVVIAGAYGHSRLAEWMFGGVTGSLLASTPVCCLLSH